MHMYILKPDDSYLARPNHLDLWRGPSRFSCDKCNPSSSPCRHYPSHKRPVLPSPYPTLPTYKPLSSPAFLPEAHSL